MPLLSYVLASVGESVMLVVTVSPFHTDGLPFPSPRLLSLPF